MASFGIILGEGPYQTERWETACRIADAALDRSDKVTFFLFLDGVYNCLGTQVFSMMDKLPMDYFKGLLAKGGEIFACETCCYNRGLGEGANFYPGVKILGISAVAQMASQCDRLLSL
jgi:sulfur relay (sulfurtransferase) complex TusBCD TusD component (DsrE family)